MTLIDSILLTVKNQLGIVEEYSHFDDQLILIINTIFSTLEQIGVPKEGFQITDETAMWDDYTEDPTLQSLVKAYVYAKTRLIFDPPSSGSLMESLTKLAAEYEWRINVMVDPSKPKPEEGM